MIWGLFVELRKELLEAQKIRAQVLGFKFTFIATTLGLIGANWERVDATLLMLPAFSAVFFDFLIYSYSFSIKRIGCYIRDHIEPVLMQDPEVPQEYVMWQQFLRQPKTKQNLALYGNMGVTCLAVVLGITGSLVDFAPVLSPALIAALGVFVFLDVLAYHEPRKLGKIWLYGDSATETT